MAADVTRLSKLVRDFLLLILVISILSACDKLPFGEILFTEEKSDAVQDTQTLFWDNFSDSNSGWDHMQSEAGSTDYEDGAYHIVVNEINTDYFATPYKSFSNVRIEVDATKISGTDDNNFGIICRYRDEQNFYLGQIKSDGFFGIFKVKDGEYIQLGADMMQTSDLINQGDATNHLQLDCVEQNLGLTINGTQLILVQDAEFSAGDVGLLAGAFRTSGVHIAFDNFGVYQP
ncbi:MAG TPA: hypothetical protein G4N92_08215 [Anaerolineae bacterium]|nr:hypothetical protein [Anaerolineae bacterium]